MYFETIPQISMTRTIWYYDQYHKDNDDNSDVTVVICNYGTLDLIRVCLNSLLRFYPDIKILVVNGSPSHQPSTDYIRFMAVKHTNIKVYEKDKGHSHGINMDEAIRNFVSTDYFLLLDSDIIVKRGGFIDGMKSQLQDNALNYATGTLMIGSNENDAIGYPRFDGDELWYVHPSCSMFKRYMYLLFAPFADHGAPCVFNMKDAVKYGYKILLYPVDKYVLHLSGASWIKPSTQWRDDGDAFIRPLVTFIVSSHDDAVILSEQDDQDFDIILEGNRIKDTFVIHGIEPYNVDNYVYSKRFNIAGEYVCSLSDLFPMADSTFVKNLRLKIIENKLPEVVTIDGVNIYRRDYWQLNISML